MIILNSRLNSLRKGLKLSSESKLFGKRRLHNFCHLVSKSYLVHFIDKYKDFKKTTFFWLSIRSKIDNGTEMLIWIENYSAQEPSAN